MNKIIFILPLVLMVSQDIYSQSMFKENSQLVSTYSIVARDSVTGEMGVAVQSHWFNVGPLVAWGESGVGVIVTQSFVNVSYGLRGLELLKQGKSPDEVVSELTASDEGRDFRQLAALDVNGRTASFTGSKCIDGAGNIAGNNYSVQANLMLNDKVWGAMEKAFLESKGPLAERMLEALEAAQQVGGDIRGMQSASLVIYRGTPTGKPWEDKLIDLRVEDNPNPVREIKRLLEVQRAYEHMNNGDLAVEKKDMELAMKEYRTAMQMFPDNLEMKYWTAVAMANNGKIDVALALFKEVFEKDKNWLELTGRLPRSDLLKVNDIDLQKILNVK